MSDAEAKTPLLSIVMPVYNAGNYLEQTFDGLLGQTFQDFEVFAVDDGSTDESPAICDLFEKEDSRIHVFHLANKGSWNARNTGIEHATGKYLYFMDADDWIETGWLESLVVAAEKYDADLVVAGFSMDYETPTGTTCYEKKLEQRIFSSQKEFHKELHNFLNESVMSLPWNKLFLRARVEEDCVRFKQKKMPDHFFCFDYLRNVENVVFIEGGGYHWRRALASSNTQRDNKSIELFATRREHYQVMADDYEYWGLGSYQPAQEALATFLVGRAAQCAQEIACNKEITKDRKLELIAGIIEDDLVQHCIGNANPQSKMMSVLIWPFETSSPRLACNLYRFVGAVRSAFPSVFYRLKEHAVHGV
jgi:glycosyltransferase involved in cell wall biosynthesis